MTKLCQSCVFKFERFLSSMVNMFCKLAPYPVGVWIDCICLCIVAIFVVVNTHGTRAYVFLPISSLTQGHKSDLQFLFFKSSLAYSISFSPIRCFHRECPTFLNICIGLRRWQIFRYFQYSRQNHMLLDGVRVLCPWSWTLSSLLVSCDCGSMICPCVHFLYKSIGVICIEHWPLFTLPLKCLACVCRRKGWSSGKNCLCQRYMFLLRFLLYVDLNQLPHMGQAL